MWYEHVTTHVRRQCSPHHVAQQCEFSLPLSLLCFFFASLFIICHAHKRVLLVCVLLSLQRDGSGSGYSRKPTTPNERSSAALIYTYTPAQPNATGNE